MNGNDLLNDLLRKLYIEDPAGLSGTILTGLQADCVDAINRALQTLWTAPFDFFRRRHFQFNTVSGTQEYDLEAATGLALQEVLGPVKINGATPHLRPVRDRGDFDNYATRFLSSLTNTVANARPVAYYLERLFQNAADGVQCKMLFTPTPDDAYSVDFEGSVEAPTYTLAQLQAEPDIPIPHSYVESVLLPVARLFVARSHYFMADQRQAELQNLQQDFMVAMRQLGDTDPTLPKFELQPQPQ